MIQHKRPSVGKGFLIRQIEKKQGFARKQLLSFVLDDFESITNVSLCEFLL